MQVGIYICIYIYMPYMYISIYMPYMPRVLSLMQTATMRTFSNSELYYDAVEQACRLRLFDEIDVTTASVLAEADRDRDKRQLFHHLLQRLQSRPREVFFDGAALTAMINLQRLYECAAAAVPGLDRTDHQPLGPM